GDSPSTLRLHPERWLHGAVSSIDSRRELANCARMHPLLRKMSRRPKPHVTLHTVHAQRLKHDEVSLRDLYQNSARTRFSSVAKSLLPKSASAMRSLGASVLNRSDVKEARLSSV